MLYICRSLCMNYWCRVFVYGLFTSCSYLRFRPISFVFWCMVYGVFLFIDVVFLFMVYLCRVLVYGVSSVFGNTMRVVNIVDCVPRVHHVWRKRNTIGLQMD